MELADSGDPPVGVSEPSSTRSQNVAYSPLIEIKWVSILFSDLEVCVSTTHGGRGALEEHTQDLSSSGEKCCEMKVLH